MWLKLLKVMKDFENEMSQPGISPEEKEKARRCMKFIEIFQNRTHDDKGRTIFPKIGIFRLANQTGLVNDIEYLQREKHHIRKIIEENIRYAQNEDDDFHYSVQLDSKWLIPSLRASTRQRLINDISYINTNLEDKFLEFEKKHFEIKELYENMETSHQIISQINSTDLRTFMKQVISTTKILNISISNEYVDRIFMHIEFKDFLQKLDYVDPKSTFEMEDGLKEINKYLNESSVWYMFLMKLHDELSEYRVQKNVTTYESNVTFVIQNCDIDENQKKKITDIGLKELLDAVGLILPPAIESMTVNFFKLRCLENVLHRTMLDQAKEACSPGKIVIKGYNVKLSSYLEMDCPGLISFVDIFALNNLFIDADIHESGKKIQLIFISPTWEIIGNRQFVLNGKNSRPHWPHDASSGVGEKRDGDPGLPGKAGGKAACFLGIGDKYINDGNLKIYLNGGRGGPGQNGGRGEKIHSIIFFFLIHHLFICTTKL